MKTVQRSETLVEEPKEHINETKQVAKVQGQYQPAPQVCEVRKTYKYYFIGRKNAYVLQ